MKKIVTLGMVVVMTLALCFSVYADNSSFTIGKKAMDIKQAIAKITNPKQIELETKTIEGIVKEVNDFCIKITGEDSKVYVVPTGMLADTEEYKSMNLKAGDKATVEGPDFEKMKGNQEFSIKIDGDKELNKDEVFFSEAVPAEKGIKMGFGGSFVQKFDKEDVLNINEGEIIFPAEKITANGVTVEMKKLVTNFTVGGAVKLETKTIEGTVKEVNEFGIKINGKDDKVYVVPTGIIAASEEYKSMNLKAGDSITVEGPDFEKMMGDKAGQKNVMFFGTQTVGNAEALPGDVMIDNKAVVIKKFDQAETLKLDENDIVFPAEKITANGVTIDIQKLMMDGDNMFHIEFKSNN